MKQSMAKLKIKDNNLRQMVSEISSNQGDYVSISGEENIYTNWAPGEKGDGINKGEKYTSFSLFDNSNRDPGMIMSTPNRQYNTPELIERGGAHLFCGLAEIKKN